MDWVTRSVVLGLIVAAASAAGVVLALLGVVGMCPLVDWRIDACIVAIAGLAWVWLGSRFTGPRFQEGLILLVAGAVTAKLLIDWGLSWEWPSTYRGLAEVLGACAGGTIGLAIACGRGVSWWTRLLRSGSVLVLLSMFVATWFYLQDRYGAASRLRGEDVRYHWLEDEIAIWTAAGGGDWLGTVEGSFGIEFERDSGIATAESRGMMDEQQLAALADSLLRDMRRRIDSEIERSLVPAVFRNLPLRGCRIRAALRARVIL